MNIAIQAIEYHLPERVLSNSELSQDFPDLSAEKIENKTGISERHIAAGHGPARSPDLCCGVAEPATAAWA
jgi:3-oxoacyl-[acyl-carrier-protein] synthase-3